MAWVKTPDEEAGLAEQLQLELVRHTEFERGLRMVELRHELDLIPSEEFAKALGLGDQTLAGWRSEGQGPSFVKLGKTVFYRRELIKDWIGRSITVLPKAA